MFCVLKCGSFSWGSALLMEGGSQNQRIVILTPSIPPAHFFSLTPSPFRAQSKKVTTQRNPNQDRKCGLICCMLVPRCGARDCSPQAHAQLQLQSRHEKAPGEQKKKNPTKQHSTRVTISEAAGARPSPLPVHKSQHEV